MRSPQSLTILLLSLTVLAGCHKEDAITALKVSYPDRESLRMLGAIIPFKDAVWVFKLQGPADEIQKEKPRFDEFLSSLQFDDSKEPPLTWKAPLGWKEEGASGMRLASFRIPAARDMELTVTALPKEGGSVLQNVNRWRKQLALPPLEADELGAETRRAQLGGQDASLVDLTGLGSHSVSKQPAAAAPGLTGRFAKGALPQATPGRGGVPFTYDVPPSWDRDARPAGLSTVSFSVREGGKKASVTLTPLGGGAGGWMQNVERWRGQVKLPKLSEAELARQVSDLEVAGVPAKYVDIDNPEAPVADNRILGVILPLPDSTWFFKMMGPSEVVGRHKGEFEALVKSVKLGAKE